MDSWKKENNARNTLQLAKDTITPFNTTIQSAIRSQNVHENPTKLIALPPSQAALLPPSEPRRFATLQLGTIPIDPLLAHAPQSSSSLPVPMPTPRNLPSTLRKPRSCGFCGEESCTAKTQRDRCLNLCRYCHRPYGTSDFQCTGLPTGTKIRSSSTCKNV